MLRARYRDRAESNEIAAMLQADTGRNHPSAQRLDPCASVGDVLSTALNAGLTAFGTTVADALAQGHFGIYGDGYDPSPQMSVDPGTPVSRR